MSATKSWIVKLIWDGPFSVESNSVQTSEHAGDQGIYLIVADHQVYGPRSLLYIGKAMSFGRRFDAHSEWLSHEWNVEIYLAPIKGTKLLGDAEALLIYAHSPPYNSSSISDLGQIQPLRIFNLGHYWGLYPEVSEEYCRERWYKPSTDQS